jgi:hypothetical protein
LSSRRQVVTGESRRKSTVRIGLAGNPRAWANAKAYPGDLSRRLDCDDRIICWSEYGKHSALGWEIDHVNPIALGGGDYPANLRARHWIANSRAGGLLGGLLGLGSR